MAERIQYIKTQKPRGVEATDSWRHSLEESTEAGIVTRLRSLRPEQGAERLGTLLHPKVEVILISIGLNVHVEADPGRGSRRRILGGAIQLIITLIVPEVDGGLLVGPAAGRQVYKLQEQVRR